MNFITPRDNSIDVACGNIMVINTLKSLGEIVDESEYVRKCKFVYEGNIYDRYNAESGRLYWLQGIKDYYVEMHPSEIPTRDAVDDYCKRNARRAENGEKAEE